MTNGTLFVVCDVLGFPSSLSISSALLTLYQQSLNVRAVWDGLTHDPM